MTIFSCNSCKWQRVKAPGGIDMCNSCSFYTNHPETSISASLDRCMQKAIQSIYEKKNSLILKALEVCGYDEEYILNHKEEFYVDYQSFGTGEIWYRNGIELFRIVEASDGGGIDKSYQYFLKWYIKFPEVKDI